MEDYLSVARKIFAGLRYEASEEDIKRLFGNMALLEKRGLGKLNKRLIDSNKVKEVLNTIAEHNFAVMLVSQLSPTILLSYEPSELQPPPDFKAEIGDVTYWIQMKDLSKLERENRQDELIQEIKRRTAEKVKVGKFFSCMLSDNFKKSCLPELINFIKDKAASSVEGECLLFTSTNNQEAKIEFWSAGRIVLSELTLGYAGDSEIVEITGLAKEQIRGSLIKAVKTFNWGVDQKKINLIAMEADNKEDIDICDAIFGTEYELFVEGKHSWCRKEDGLFIEPDFSGKVAGVIAIKRKRERANENEIFPLSAGATEFAEYCNMTQAQIKEALEWKDPGPIADYSMILYMNDRFKHLQENIKRLLNFDKVVSYNMRPPMGKGDFGLS